MTLSVLQQTRPAIAKIEQSYYVYSNNHHRYWRCSLCDFVVRNSDGA